MKNLRLRITILIVLAIIVVTGILSFISYRRASESMSKQLENNYRDIADKYAQEITAWMNTNAALVESLAAYITTTEIYKEIFIRNLGVRILVNIDPFLAEELLKVAEAYVELL